MSAIPRHIAIVMDGNRRWARQRHLPAIAGHRAGVETIRKTLRAARERGVEYLTLYSFSTENWSRDPEEVTGLMGLLEETIRRETDSLVRDDVRLRVIGRLHELSPGLQKSIAGAVEATSKCAHGVDDARVQLRRPRRDRRRGAAHRRRRRRAGRRRRGGHRVRVCTRPSIPTPTCSIRTGGELRVSNFLLWEVAYAEMWATPVLWPDFSVSDLDDALGSYAKRERRFGR